ncbi:hypothetical protein CPLU01_08282 [Colletotrichum plurivorum]|uniref:Uncharacterized protein n=1 Tax=Colletotrichum plurivorum TaxID=2175906 RepID=A0A8H6ND26_9PEZI|nr:hypothetical protein CPLU01_08282 [Colletotrichum plurivorum]
MTILQLSRKMAPSPEQRLLSNLRSYRHWSEIHDRLQSGLSQASATEIVKFASLIVLPPGNDADLNAVPSSSNSTTVYPRPDSDRHTLAHLMMLMGMEVNPSFPGHYRPARGFSPDLSNIRGPDARNPPGKDLPETEHIEHVEDMGKAMADVGDDDNDDNASRVEHVEHVEDVGPGTRTIDDDNLLYTEHVEYIEDMDEDVSEYDDDEESLTVDDGTEDESTNDNDIAEHEYSYDLYDDEDDGEHMDEMDRLRKEMEDTVVDISFYFYSSFRMPREDAELDAKNMFWLRLARDHIRVHRSLILESEQWETTVQRLKAGRWKQNTQIAVSWGLPPQAMFVKGHSPLAKVDYATNIDGNMASTQDTSEPMELD